MDRQLNPYNPGSGLQPPQFVGRDRELTAFDTLRARARNNTVGRPLGMSGFRGVGKTVLLRRMSSMAEQHGWFSVTLEAQTTAGGAEAVRTQLSRELLAGARRFSARHWGQQATAKAKDLLDAIGGFTLTIANVTVARNPASAARASSGLLEVDIQELVEDISEAARHQNVAFGLFVDELQDLDPDLLAALLTAQHQAQQRNQPFYLIGAGLPNLPAVLTEAKSYAERLFEYSTIGPLPDDLTEDALASPARTCGAEFSPEALTILIDASGGYPYFIQELGRAIWNLAPDKTFTATDAKGAIDVAFAELDAGFFPGRWDKATPAEQDYLSALATIGNEGATATIADTLARTPAALSKTRDRLIHKGILYSPRRGIIGFTVPGMADYINRHR